jgi:hypothetical protein
MTCTCISSRRKRDSRRRRNVRLCREIAASRRLLIGRHRKVLLAVEIVPRDVNHLHLLISDLHAFGVEVAASQHALRSASVVVEPMSWMMA